MPKLFIVPHHQVSELPSDFSDPFRKVFQTCKRVAQIAAGLGVIGIEPTAAQVLNGLRQSPMVVSHAQALKVSGSSA